VTAESEWVRLAQSGDDRAFAELFHRHVRRVQQTAYLICGDHRIAEDLMQEAFTQAFRTIHQLREPEAFAGWLYRITVRLARRAASRRRAEQAATERLSSIAPTALPSPAEAAAERQALWAAIQGLPADQRTAIVLHYYQDLPLQQVATLMETREGTVKSWLHRGRTRLAKALRAPLTGEEG
jgi:RNA polymerase sigma-70 factor (ECF subfamily)